MDFSVVSTIEKAEEGEWMTVVLPNGEETDAAIKLAGQDSRAYKKCRNEFINRRQGGAMSAEQLQAGRLKLVCACVLATRNVNEGDTAITVETIAQFFGKYPWVLDQADEFVHNRKEYLPEETLGKSELGANGAVASSSAATVRNMSTRRASSANAVTQAAS